MINKFDIQSYQKGFADGSRNEKIIWESFILSSENARTEWEKMRCDDDQQFSADDTYSLFELISKQKNEAQQWAKRLMRILSTTMQRCLPDLFITWNEQKAYECMEDFLNRWSEMGDTNREQKKTIGEMECTIIELVQENLALKKENEILRKDDYYCLD